MARQSAATHIHKSKTLGNKYMLGDEIGKGAYGRVYKGLDLENGDFVAIKQVSLENISTEDLSTIMLEIDLLKNLNHKNIVKYLGSLKTETHLHIILEYVENGSLANIIHPNKFGPFPESLVAVYIVQVLEGLVYLHEQGVIHRDIKGANILTTKEGLVKLADFGVATTLTEVDVDTNSVVGTPYWMAPEVIDMSGVSAASDIWSVGCTVIELLTCVPPYFDLNYMAALYHIVQDVHPPIPDGLSPEITDFLHQCFRKDARQRPDAKTLLMHPWIQNSRKTLPSVRKNGDSIRNINEDGTVSENAQYGSQCPEGSKGTAVLGAEQGEDFSVTDSLKSNVDHNPILAQNVCSNFIVNKTQDMISAKDPNLVFDEQPLFISAMVPHQLEQDVMVRKVEVMSPELNENLKDIKGKESSTVYGSNFSFGNKAKDNNPQKVFDKNKVSESPSPMQSVEFSKMIGSLKPDASDEVIVSACQKIISLFSQRPEQKHVYMSQHGFLPLIELLDVRKTCVVCSILELINHIIKDNTDFQENACLVGLIPAVMNFAVPENPREIRIQAAFFLQQLCFSSALTLQMFVACRGIPALVGFLEADYANFGEMIRFAIDGIWQVFKLQQSTPRKDFCCIAAKNGILLKLINTLYNLNEATCLASLAGGETYILRNGSASRPTSGPLDAPTSATMHMDSPGFLSDHLDASKLRLDHPLSAVSSEQMRKPACHSQRTEATQTLSKQCFGDGDEQHSNSGILEAFTSSKFPEVGVENIDNCVTSIGPREHEYSLKHDHSHSDCDLPRHQIGENFGSINLIDRPTKHTEVVSNAHSSGANLSAPQHEKTRPLLSLLEQEPPSRPESRRLDYIRHISGLDRHESILPLLHTSYDGKKLNSVISEFADVSRYGQENGDLDSSIKPSSKSNKKVSHTWMSTNSNQGASTSGDASQTASDVISGSGVLNARIGSATSSELSQMVSSMSAGVVWEYLEKVADLLLEFAQADTIVRSYMCNHGLLARLFQMLDKLELPILLKILKCINHLSNDPICLESLQRADAIKHLIPNLELHGGPPVFQIHSEVLNALFNLCKISKRRQDQAAENGIIPQLMKFIVSNSSLKQYALPLLCDMAHASRKSRDQLTAHGGLNIYLDLLEDEAWAVTALDSLAVCLAHDCDHRKVEQVLLEKEAIQKLVMFFRNCPEQHFVSILEPLLKIITKSSRINTAMATNGFTALLIARLDNEDARARLNLLKLIKVVYEYHPKPKQLIVQNDLPQKLQKLIEERRDGERSGQVLVKQMATALLKALHINTVL